MVIIVIHIIQSDAFQSINVTQSMFHTLTFLIQTPLKCTHSFRQNAAFAVALLNRQHLVDDVLEVVLTEGLPKNLKWIIYYKVITTRTHKSVHLVLNKHQQIAVTLLVHTSSFFKYILIMNPIQLLLLLDKFLPCIIRDIPQHFTNKRLLHIQISR